MGDGGKAIPGDHQCLWAGVGPSSAIVVSITVHHVLK